MKVERISEQEFAENPRRILAEVETTAFEVYATDGRFICSVGRRQDEASQYRELLSRLLGDDVTPERLRDVIDLMGRMTAEVQRGAEAVKKAVTKKVNPMGVAW